MDAKYILQYEMVKDKGKTCKHAYLYLKWQVPTKCVIDTCASKFCKWLLRIEGCKLDLQDRIDHLNICTAKRPSCSLHCLWFGPFPFVLYNHFQEQTRHELLMGKSNALSGRVVSKPRQVLYIDHSTTTTMANKHSCSVNIDAFSLANTAQLLCISLL